MRAFALAVIVVFSAASGALASEPRSALAATPSPSPTPGHLPRLAGLPDNMDPPSPSPPTPTPPFPTVHGPAPCSEPKVLYKFHPELGTAKVCIDDTEDMQTHQLHVNAFMELVSSIPDDDADGQPDDQDGDPWQECSVKIEIAVWNPLVVKDSNKDCLEQANDAGIHPQYIHGDTWIPVQTGQSVQAFAIFDVYNTATIGTSINNYFHATPIWIVPGSTPPASTG